ncbi:hypothetical protein LCGC14_1273160 [marine sediment metagenome]|uniref:HNH nuclease domain-containing protein n=1 Tax=marine sediment metagenome TaxID=412755 RepID=A0A0F9P0G9_9ZZZZ
MSGKRYRLQKTERLQLKIKLLVAHGSNCWWCEEPFSPDDWPTFEHVNPLSLGGTWSFENLRLTHESCNEMRANHYPISYEVK